MLTRDGTSSYYINNQPVRRRDVQDVFLGTGLGPRAYAIIGQGTISRIIQGNGVTASMHAMTPGGSTLDNTTLRVNITSCALYTS